MAFRLIDPIEFAQFKTEAADQSFDGAVLWIQSDKGGIHIRDLCQTQLGIIYRPDQI